MLFIIPLEKWHEYYFPQPYFALIVYIKTIVILSKKKKALYFLSGHAGSHLKIPATQWITV
jgi:hypothetical protein